jgi:drug/metabolite transporter (DMT)-like permease
MMAGSVVLLVVSVGVGELGAFHIAQVSFASWMGWLYLVTFGSIVGFTAYVYLLRTVSPAKVSTYAYVNPVVAVFLGWALAGEPVTMRTLVAAAIILGGVALITISQNNAV